MTRTSPTFTQRARPQATSATTLFGATTRIATQRALDAMVASGTTPGLQYVFVASDAVMYQHAAGLADVGTSTPVQPTHTFNGFSVTKTATAVAILQLAEQGRLQLDRPAAEYLPDFQYGCGVTIRHLLTHTAGIANPIPLRWVHPVDAHRAFDRREFFRRQFAAHPGVRSGPGERRSYSNLGYQLLGDVIEAVSGESYEAYVTREILQRAGLAPQELGFTLEPARHARGYHRRRTLSYALLGLLLDRTTALEQREGAWHKFHLYHMNGAAYGGLIGTAAGFARYLQALLDPRGVLLSPAARAELFRSQPLRNGRPSGTALGWFTGVIDGQDYLDHAGGGGGYYAELRLYPQQNAGSVLLCNRTGLKNERWLDQLDRCLLESLGGQRRTQPQGRVA